MVKWYLICIIYDNAYHSTIIFDNTEQYLRVQDGYKVNCYTMKKAKKNTF